MSGRTLRLLLVLAGAGQLGLVLASTLIPKLLHWREETVKLRPLTRQVFTIYALYILGINLAFGLLSLLRPEWLLTGSGLARAVAGFIGLYWGARLVIQSAYYDRKDAPPGLLFRIGEVALVVLFLFLTCVYDLVAFGLRVR